jgi:hypothetical protein
MSSEKKKIIANLLIKKQSINNINELHDLYCSDEDIKNNNFWDGCEQRNDPNYE